METARNELSVPPPKFLASSRPRRAGACGAEAGVDSCARSVTHLRDALPRVLVVSLAPPADAAKYAADLGVETLVKASPGGAEPATSSGEIPRVYKPQVPRGWWLRQRHYFLYMVREFTAVPLALWLIWLLFEIQRASAGPKGYYPPVSAAFVVFSVILLGFALYHSYT